MKGLISVEEASLLSGFTEDHIRKRIRKGDIEGIKVGRDWRTTREAVLAYVRTERRPGPKAKKRARR